MPASQKILMPGKIGSLGLANLQRSPAATTRLKGQAAGEAARAYFGADTGSYDSRSAIKGLTQIEEPILLAWSSADAPYFIAQGEKLKDMLCAAGHCPRTAVISTPSSPASIFDLDGASADLHERLRQLIGQIDARGLP